MTGVAGALQKAEQWLGSIVATVAALLVIAEIIVLFTGVSARYFFQKPIIWSDELSGILFLWLAMLGAVTAFQRGEHMRMTAFVGMVSPGKRAFFDVLAIAAPLAFLALVLQPAYEFASDEAFVSTPGLDISSLWRVAALPVGLGLMLLIALLRLLSFGDRRLTASAVGVIAVVGGALYLLGPFFYRLATSIFLSSS
jgi:TRAP-type C4-dicarboxylate transport system permease small subunit